MPRNKEDGRGFVRNSKYWYERVCEQGLNGRRPARQLLRQHNPRGDPHGKTLQTSARLPALATWQWTVVQEVKKHYYYSGPRNEPETADARCKLGEEAGGPSQVPQIDTVTVEPNQTKSFMPMPGKGFPLSPHPNGQ